MRGPLLLLAVSFCVSLAFDEVIPVSKGWNVTMSELSALRSRLTKTKEDTWMYHWATSSECRRWITQGNVNQSELDWLNANGYGIGGGGFYVSTDPGDSAGFGSVQLRTLIPKDSYIYTPSDKSLLQKVLNHTLVDPDKSLIGAVVPFIDDYMYNNWRVVHSERFTRVVEAGSNFQPDAQEVTKLSGMRNVMFHIARKEYNDNLAKKEASRLALYWSAIDVYGSLVAGALISKEENLTSLEADYRLQQNELAQRYFLDSRGLPISTMFDIQRFNAPFRSVETQKSTWLEYMQTFLFGYSIYDLDGGGTEYRNFPLQTLGHEVKNATRVTPLMLQRLEANPYLTIEIVDKSENEDSLVVINHPDASHVDKLINQGFLSANLVRDLSLYTKKEIAQNTTLFKELTTSLLQELVQDLYEKYFNTSVDEQKFNFYNDLLSISPLMKRNFEGNSFFNNLMINGFLQTCNLPYNETLKSFAPEWSLLYHKFDKKPTLQPTVWGGDSSVYRDMMHSMNMIFYKNWLQQSVPQYSQTWSREIQNIPEKFQGKIVYDDITVTLLKSRKYIELFDRIAPKWRDTQF